MGREKGGGEEKGGWLCVCAFEGGCSKWGHVPYLSCLTHVRALLSLPTTATTPSFPPLLPTHTPHTHTHTYIPSFSVSPTAKQMDESFLHVTAKGETVSGRRAQATLYFPTCPGYRDTARMLVESGPFANNPTHSNNSTNPTHCNNSTNPTHSNNSMTLILIIILITLMARITPPRA